MTDHYPQKPIPPFNFSSEARKSIQKIMSGVSNELGPFIEITEHWAALYLAVKNSRRYKRKKPRGEVRKSIEVLNDKICGLHKSMTHLDSNLEYNSIVMAMGLRGEKDPDQIFTSVIDGLDKIHQSLAVLLSLNIEELREAYGGDSNNLLLPEQLFIHQWELLVDLITPKPKGRETKEDEILLIRKIADEYKSTFDRTPSKSPNTPFAKLVSFILSEIDPEQYPIKSNLRRLLERAFSPPYV